MACAAAAASSRILIDPLQEAFASASRRSYQLDRSSSSLYGHHTPSSSDNTTSNSTNRTVTPRSCSNPQSGNHHRQNQNQQQQRRASSHGALCSVSGPSSSPSPPPLVPRPRNLCVPLLPPRQGRSVRGSGGVGGGRRERMINSSTSVKAHQAVAGSAHGQVSNNNGSLHPVHPSPPPRPPPPSHPLPPSCVAIAGPSSSCQPSNSSKPGANPTGSLCTNPAPSAAGLGGSLPPTGAMPAMRTPLAGGSGVGVSGCISSTRTRRIDRACMKRSSVHIPIQKEVDLDQFSPPPNKVKVGMLSLSFSL